MHVELGGAGGAGGLMALSYIPKCGLGGRCCLRFPMVKRQDKNWRLIHRMLRCHSPIVLENKVHS